MKLQVIFNYLASFVKQTWKVDDYPIRVTEQRQTKDAHPKNLATVSWVVDIVNWWQMFGIGPTKQEALVDLQRKLEKYKQEHGTLPRPGTRVPLKFASTNEIDQYNAIARDYFRRVLNMDYDQCFISDESSLMDFFSEEDYIEKTQRLYGVDISDINGGNLVQIFKRLHESQAAG